MSSKTKIVVLRMKELIYTGIFVLLGILLILLLITMFSPGKTDSQEESSPVNQYIPGVYHASFALGGNPVDLELVTESDYIASIRLIDLDASTATLYPLVESTLEALAEQIYHTQSLENLTLPEDALYTAQILLKAIENAALQASPESEVPVNATISGK